jgi:hypothetical protein
VEASQNWRCRVAALVREDMVRPRYDVSGTSQRTKSHLGLPRLSEANVCTPRPTSSRVTTADGRSPGSRVVTVRRLPRTEISQWHMTKDSPLTVAGAAAALGKFPRTAFPFDPQTGEPSPVSRILPGEESMPSFGHVCCAPRVRILFADAACARSQSLYEHGT